MYFIKFTTNYGSNEAFICKQVTFDNERMKMLHDDNGSYWTEIDINTISNLIIKFEMQS